MTTLRSRRRRTTAEGSWAGCEPVGAEGDPVFLFLARANSRLGRGGRLRPTTAPAAQGSSDTRNPPCPPGGVGSPHGPGTRPAVTLPLLRKRESPPQNPSLRDSCSAVSPGVGGIGCQGSSRSLENPRMPSGCFCRDSSAGFFLEGVGGRTRHLLLKTSPRCPGFMPQERAGPGPKDHPRSRVTLRRECGFPPSAPSTPSPNGSRRETKPRLSEGPCFAWPGISSSSTT